MLKPVILWLARSLVVGATYLVALMLVGAFLTALGVRFASANQGPELLPALLVGGIIMGMVLGPPAGQIAATCARRLVIWTCVIFLNLVSVIVEGAFFAPAQIGGNLPALVVQQFILAVLTASVITLLFARRAHATPTILPLRSWTAWIRRLALSSASYIVFYFIFGTINYAPVTRAYYESHAGGLAAPGIEIILVAETIRGVLIVLSVLPLLMIMTVPTRERAAWTGVTLTAIGGIVPLLYQVNALPGPLLIASGVEIFFQNFSTGVVAALLLGQTGRPAP